MAAVILLASASGADALSTVARRVEPGLDAEIVNGKQIYLLAEATSQESQRLTAELVMQEPDRYRNYARSQGLRVPLYRLNPEYRRTVTEALFTHDEPTPSGWRHRVTYADNSRDGGESLWRIAEWFTGTGQNWGHIARHNGLSGRTALRVGQTVLIPQRVLLAAYRTESAPRPAPPPPALPPPAPPPPLAAPIPVRQAAPQFSSGELTYHRDAEGEYARYRMKPGETLYTDVVVRFTGRVAYADVMSIARDVAERSGIRDVTRIPNGQAVKIPLDLLSVEYRPPTDPRRLEYEREQELASSYFNTRRRQNLQGITVVLDAGHGGADPGTTGVGWLYEDEVCYDVAVRAKRILEQETAAHVELLVLDRSQQYTPSDRTRFSDDTDEVLLTHPPYTMTNAKTAVNLRWYLANSIYRRAVAAGAKPEDVLFTSFHADALHPDVYGAMVYIPGAQYTQGTNGRGERVFTRRAEVREAQYVRIDWGDRVKMEGRSRNFAQFYINALRRARLPVHSNKPIRNVIHRGRRTFVPGVIRQNLIPNKVLIELANLKNDQDAERMRDPAFREQLARAYVEAVVEYYGGEPDGRLAQKP